MLWNDKTNWLCYELIVLYFWSNIMLGYFLILPSFVSVMHFCHPRALNRIQLLHFFKNSKNIKQVIHQRCNNLHAGHRPNSLYIEHIWQNCLLISTNMYEWFLQTMNCHLLSLSDWLWIQHMIIWWSDPHLSNALHFTGTFNHSLTFILYTYQAYTSNY